MSYNCEIKDLSAQPTMSIRTKTSVAELPNTLGVSYAIIAQYLVSQGEQPAGAPYVVYYNMDMENLEIEVGFPVSKQLPGQAEVQPSEIPSGKYGAYLYKGPYQEMNRAYDELTEWLQGKGCEVTGVAYEFYLNNPADTSPQELLTQILFPLRSS